MGAIGRAGLKAEDHEFRTVEAPRPPRNIIESRDEFGGVPVMQRGLGRAGTDGEFYHRLFGEPHPQITPERSRTINHCGERLAQIPSGCPDK